jgi:hypothetical protein
MALRAGYNPPLVRSTNARHMKLPGTSPYYIVGQNCQPASRKKCARELKYTEGTEMKYDD